MWYRLGLLVFSVLFVASADPAWSQTRLPEKRLSPLAMWSWKPIGALSEPRELPRLVSIDNDRVIIIGGGSELRETASQTTEIYRPTYSAWTPGPKLHKPRRDSEAIRLTSGKIVIIGGSEGPSRTGTKAVELLDVNTGTSIPLADMLEARIGHTATLLVDGKILVVGGQSSPSHFLATAEIYDSSSNSWVSAGRLQEPRAMHHTRLLKDGTVLVMGGGTDVTATNTAEIFEPTRRQWLPVGSMREPRWGFASTVLSDGRVLVAGGRVPAKKGGTIAEDVMVILRGAELYDPAKRSWSDAAPMNIPRTMGIANVELAQVHGGSLLFAGGRTYPAPYHGTTSAEAYDPTENRWSLVRSMNIGRSYQAVMALPQGDILIAGGRGVQFLPLNAVECFQP